MTLAAALDTRIDEAVALLASDDPIAAMLGDGWTRSYGRLATRGESYATLVYEHGGREPLRVDLFASPRHGARAVPSLGYAMLAPCSDDPALQTLPQALTTFACTEIIRYRPGKRCTFRGEAGGRPVFVKVFNDDRGAAMAADALRLQSAADEFDFAIARCLGWRSELRAIAHAALPGAPIAQALLGGDGATAAARVGDALASLPRSGAAASASFAANEQMARTRKYARQFVRAMPALAGPIGAFVATLQTAHEGTPDTPLRTIHGAPHPQQWLQAGNRLALVDFDRLSAGPVELDVATFVAELDFEAGDTTAQCQAFVDAFAARAGSCDTRLLNLYRSHKYFAKALKAALAINPDRETRARSVLERGLALLGGAAS